MTIEVTCDCSMTYRLPDRFAGKTARCRECRESIPVPAAETERSKKNAKVVTQTVSKKAVEKALEKTEKVTKTSKIAKVTKIAKKASKAKSHAHPVSDRYASESIHQMSPLNLSESRASDSPSARTRARALKARSGGVGLLTKKKSLKKIRRGGRDESEALDSESETEVRRAPPKKGKKALRRRDDDSRNDEDEESRPAKKKKKLKGKKGKKALRRRVDSDEEIDEASEDARPAKGKKPAKKKALKNDGAKKSLKTDSGKTAASKLLTGSGRTRARRPEGDEDENADTSSERSTKKLTRAERRRKQFLILGGSLALAAACIAILFGVIAMGKHSEEKARWALDESTTRIAAAQAAAKSQDWDKAQKLYKDTIAFVEENSARIEDSNFFASYKLFKAENDQFIGKIVAARAKLGSDPQGAISDFTNFAWAGDDEVVSLAGVEGLVASNDGASVELLATFAKSSRFQSVKDAAVKGLIQQGSPAATPFLATIIRKDPKSPLAHQAAERALEGMNPDADALMAVAESADLDAGVRGKALQKLGGFRDKKYEPIFERLKNDPAVSKAAADGLSELRGEKP